MPVPQHGWPFATLLDEKLTADDLSSANADEIYTAASRYPAEALAAVAFRNALAGGGGGGGAISVASVNLTNAQVLALPTTGVNVVAAPGANKLLFLFGAFMYLKWTADYTNIDANCILALGYGTRASSSGTGLLGSNDVSGLLAFGEDGTAFLPGLGQVPALKTSVLGYGGLDDPPNLVNQPLTLLASNGGEGDFTGGDPANTLQVSVFYSELTLL
jgi:hypothetical protein